MSEHKLIAAHTNADSIYPAYINFSREPDGRVRVTLRSNPKVNPDGYYICGYARDKGQPGRCTAGDERCNNYCNMAPEKGPMQKHPKECVQIREGATAEATFSAEDFDALIAEAAARP